MFLFDFLFDDFNDADYRGSENDIDAKLDDEIDPDQPRNKQKYVLSACPFFRNSVAEKQYHSDKENSRIYDRRGCGSEQGPQIHALALECFVQALLN